VHAVNLFQLVFKQMRQRALSTWLTLLSVVLGVTLVVAIMILRREGQALFGQTEYGYDVLVGPKGSPLQLTLNTVYHMDKSPGNIPYSLLGEITGGEQYRGQVKWAVPFAVGDTYEGHRIVGTSLRMFNVDDAGKTLSDGGFEYRPGRSYELASGRHFHPRKFEAVIGSEIPQLTGLKIGDKFKATHGTPSAQEIADVHDEQWEVVGILKPTHTANDRVLFIPLISFYCVGEHGEGLEAQAQIRQGVDPSQIGSPATQQASRADADSHDGSEKPAQPHHHHHEHKPYALAPDGTIDLKIPPEHWAISAILVRSQSPFAAQQLMYVVNNRPEAAAVNPATVMREFFDTFLDTSAKILLLIACMVTVVAAASIMTTIYNSVVARRKEMAILRALGATRARVLQLICVEAGLVGLLGAVFGLLVGHGLAAVGSVYLSHLVGEGIDWLAVGGEEAVYFICVVLIALAAGLVPAMKAYSTPVAAHLATA
jgi:putative ABC transport system permease protein